MKISKTGYKKNSKDKNEPALVIPSNKITMKDVDFPVYGTDDTGYSQMMYPGLDYTFPGSYVYELPMAQDGGYILPGRFKNPEGNWVSKYANGGPGDSKRVTINANQQTSNDRNVFQESSVIQNPNNIEDAIKMYTRSVNVPGKEEKFMEYFQTPDSSSFKYNHPFFGQHEIVTRNPLLKKLGDKYFSSKFDMGGDISIPDLSKSSWLDKYQKGGEIEKNAAVSTIWKQITGTPWSEAKAQGLTDGSFEANLDLRKRLLSGEFGKVSFKKQSPAPATKKTEEPVAKAEKPKRIKDPLRYELMRVDQPTAVAESTYREIPNINKAPKIAEEVKQEAQRVKKVMKETGAKSPAEVYQKEKELEKMQQVAANQQSTLSVAPEKGAEDYMRFAKDVALNPLTAVGYKIRGEEIPWGFTKGERNPLDIATDVVNPATYAKAAYNTATELVDPNTYISTLPKSAGALGGLLFGEEVPEEWNNEGMKALGIMGDAISLAPIVPKGLSQLDKAYNFGKGFTSSALPAVSERVISKIVTPTGKLSLLEKETLDKVDNLSALVDRYSTTMRKGVGKKGMQNLLANESDRTALVTLSENLHPDVVKKILGTDVFDDVKSMLNTSTDGLSGTNLTKTQQALYGLNDKLQKYAKSLKNSSNDPAMYQYGKKMGSQYFPRGNEKISFDGADGNVISLLDNMYNADKNTITKLRGALKTVLDAAPGERFVGSTNLSNNSWTTTANAMDEFMTKGIVKYDGYKMGPLNPQAYSYKTNVPEIIAADVKKINNQIAELNRKHKLNLPKAWVNPTSLEVIAPYVIAKKMPKPTKLQYGGYLNKYQYAGTVKEGPYKENDPGNSPQAIIGPDKNYVQKQLDWYKEWEAYQKIDPAQHPLDKMDEYKRLREKAYKNFPDKADTMLGGIRANELLMGDILLGPPQGKILKAIDFVGDVHSLAKQKDDYQKAEQGSLEYKKTLEGLMKLKRGGYSNNRYQDGGSMEMPYGLLSRSDNSGAPWAYEYPQSNGNLPSDYNMQRALELGYTPDKTGHWDSVDSETGMWLKSKQHPTSWVEYMQGQLTPEVANNLNVVANPEGYFGKNQLQYIPKRKKGGAKSQGEGYYDYINGYSGIFANGGTKSKEKSWLNKYK